MADSGAKPPKKPGFIDNAALARIVTLKQRYPGMRQDEYEDLAQRIEKFEARQAREAEEAEQKRIARLEQEDADLAELESQTANASLGKRLLDVGYEIVVPQDKMDWALLVLGGVGKIGKGGKILKILDKKKALAEIAKKRKAVQEELRASQKAKKGTLVEKKAMKKHEVQCFKKGKRNKVSDTEYDRQLADQEKALNQMSAEDYQKARQLYEQNKRNPAAAAEAANFRRDFQLQQQRQLEQKKLASGMSKVQAAEESAKEAADMMKGLDALHTPDLSAGGYNNPKPSDMGDLSANRSIGGQWPQNERLKKMDEAAKEAIEKHGKAVKMNVKLNRCK